MMRGYCDLHTHSIYSDGCDTPKRLIEAACEIGLSAVALTDHNTVSGLPEFLSAAKGKPITAIPGVEFSVDYEGIELHLLALCVKEEDFPRITALMESVQRRKAESNRALVEALCAAGYVIDYDAIRAKTPDGQFNRAHVALMLTERGYTASVKEAFETLLSEEHGFYQPPKRIDVFEMLRWIRSIGAVSVLAHPFLNLSEEALRRFLARATECGLCGMETVYSTYEAETERIAGAIAKEFYLLESGGSDYHGAVKPDIALGTGKGNLAVPYSFFEALRETAARL